MGELLLQKSHLEPLVEVVVGELLVYIAARVEVVVAVGHFEQE